MARKLVVEIIGDSSSLNRSLKEATVASNRFGKDVSHSLRGVASGTGIMHNFGRSLAFASGGFLAFEGVSHLLTDSVKAAVDAGVAQRSLTAQMKTSGESFAASSDAIEQANLGLAKFGFTSEDAVHALTVLERGTGNIQQALGLETVSADLARAKNIDLASAATVVAKVFGGQETALRRAVPGLAKNAHGLELIRLAQQRLAGQAAAGTTAGEQFAATLHDTEVIIGTALLPTLNHYLTSLTEWLDKMNRSGQLQKDVNEVVGAAKGVIDQAAGALRTLNTITGSTKNTVKLLFDAFVVFKTLRLVSMLGEIATGIRLIGTNAATSAGEVTAFKDALARPTPGGGLLPGAGGIPLLGAAAIAGMSTQPDTQPAAPAGQKGFIGRYRVGQIVMVQGGQLFKITTVVSAGFAYGEPTKAVGNLFSPGFKMPDLGVAVPTPTPPISPHDLPTSQAAAPILGAGALSAMQRNALAISAAGRTRTTKDDLAAFVTQRVLLAKAIRTETARLNQATTASAAKSFADNLQSLYDKDAAAFNQIQSLTQKAAKATTAGRTGVTAGQRNTWFDTAIGRMLDRVQDIPTLQGKIAKLKTIGGLIQKQIDAARDITRKQTLGDTLADVFRQISADQDEQKQNTADRKATAQQTLLDQLQYAVDRSALTDSLQDDLKADLAQKAGILKEIATQGRTRALLGDLLSVELAIKSKKAEIAAARADKKQAQTDKAAKQVQARLDAANLTVAKAGLTETLKDDLAANQNLLAVMRKTGASAIDIVNQQKTINDVKGQLADQITAGKKSDDKAATAADQATQTTRKLFRHLNATAFVNQFGAGLTREQKRRLEIGLAMTGPGGTLPAGRSGQFTAGITINGGVHMHGVQDVPGLENQIAKRAKARPHVRRGARG